MAGITEVVNMFIDIPIAILIWIFETIVEYPIGSAWCIGALLLIAFAASTK